MRTWLKELREQQGMSQRELAEALGVSRTIVQCWESGQSKRCARGVLDRQVPPWSDPEV